MDIFEKTRGHGGPIGQYADASHGYFLFPRLVGEVSGHMGFRGRDRIVWSLNNYLGLANHPEVRKADAEAIERFGLSPVPGALHERGALEDQEELEERLAEAAGKEATQFLNFGYQGMMSLIQAVLSENDVVVVDSECHACIFDGVRLHRGRRLVYEHNDLEHLERLLKQGERIARTSGGRVNVVTEGVFGMSGDQGALQGIRDLKGRYGFRLLVDDAHGFGVMGARGGGTGWAQGVQPEVDLYFSTFAKAMASIGAFVSGTRAEIDDLRVRLRSQVHSTPLPPAFLAGALKRLELLQAGSELRERLWRTAGRLQSKLRANGFDLGSTKSPVTPVYVRGGIHEAVNIVFDLRENWNVFCSCVAYPVVPKDVILLRLIPTAMHGEADVDRTVDAFVDVKRKLDENAYEDGFPRIVPTESGGPIARFWRN